MRTTTGCVLLLFSGMALALAGCVAPGTGQKLYLFCKSRTTPGASSYKKYIINGSGRADLNTIDGQALKARATAALAAKGFIETTNPQNADMAVFLYADIQVTKTPMTYSRPNTVFIPGTTSISTTTSQYPGGISVPSTTVTTTQGRTINAGNTLHTVERTGIVGGATMTAYDWKAWIRSGARPGVPMRVIWETEVTFNGDPPYTYVNLLEKAFDWVFAHASEEASFAQIFSPPSQIASFQPQ